jgi:Periplasmic copper-binding protein (NosD)
MRTETWIVRARIVRTSALAAVLLGLGGGGVAVATSAQASPVGSWRSASSPSESLAASSAAALRAATAEAGRQADLVAGEDQRLTQALVAGRPDPQHPSARQSPYRIASAGFRTLVLTKRRAPYTFDELRRLAPDTLVPQPGGAFLLSEHIVVAEGATLDISPPKPLVIKMSSGPDGFVSLVAQGGRLRFYGTVAAPITFESWDESHGRQDKDVSDGRAYVRASGQLIARHTTFSKLGFWSGRTGGVSVVGSGATLGKDVDAQANADSAADPTAQRGSSRIQVLPAGKLPSTATDPSGSFGTQITDSTMTGNAFGLFITGSTGPKIANTVISKSLVDGLVLHRNVDSANVTDVRVEQSGSDGVVVSREVEGTVLTRLDVRQNGRDGIVLTGRPMADGPSASGQSTRAFGNNVLTASQSTDNLRIGVHVIGGNAVRVQGNAVNGGRSGIVVSDGATEVDVDSNRVSGAATNGIQVRESRQVAVTGNTIHDSPTGIHIRNSIGVLRDNSTSGVTLHGITFVGRVAGSVVDRNYLTGSGTSAIDVVRVVDHQEPTVKQNDLSGWSRTVTSDSLLSVLLHPLTVIWMVVALALLGMSRPRRGGGRLPYRTDRLNRDRVMNRDSVISIPASAPEAEPAREPEVPVFAIPERRVPMPSPGLRPATATVTVPVRVPRAPTAPTPPRPTPPRLTPPRPTPVSEGHAVIDLAIQESRLSPVVPRRRRAANR